MEKTKNSDGVSQLLVTLKRSPIGTPQRIRLILRSLGLRKPHQTVRRPNTSQVRGLIKKVCHLLEVTPQS